jgi:hypothetical protein
MTAQMKWYEILKPFRSMLKFRLPYIGDKLNRKEKMKYLEGDIFFQIWPAGSSSECRLIVKENASKDKVYDSIKYEDQLFRFNQVERVMCYKHDVEVDGLDHCYDCRAEVFVFEEYIKIGDKLKLFSNNKIKMFETVKEYIEDINNFLNAKSKIIRITKDGKHYDLKFTDVKYGKKFEEICNSNTQTFRERKTYLNQWKMKRLEKGIFQEKTHNRAYRNPHYFSNSNNNYRKIGFDTKRKIIDEIKQIEEKTAASIFDRLGSVKEKK